MIRPTVEVEVLEVMESRQRREHEAAYRRRREGVQQHYEQLKLSGKHKTLPSLAQFRQLPIVNILQSKTSSKTDVADDLQNSTLVKELLQSDLQKWQESARAVLAATLGLPDWKNANKTKLHPVDRLTARFKCKECGPKSHAGRYLSFASACAHACARPDQKTTTKNKWSADQFEKDEQVRNLWAFGPIFCLLDFPYAGHRYDISGARALCRECGGSGVNRVG